MCVCIIAARVSLFTFRIEVSGVKFTVSLLYLFKYVYIPIYVCVCVWPRCSTYLNIYVYLHMYIFTRRIEVSGVKFTASLLYYVSELGASLGGGEVHVTGEGTVWLDDLSMTVRRG